MSIEVQKSVNPAEAEPDFPLPQTKLTIHLRSPKQKEINKKASLLSNESTKQEIFSTSCKATKGIPKYIASLKNIICCLSPIDLPHLRDRTLLIAHTDTIDPPWSEELEPQMRDHPVISKYKVIEPLCGPHVAAVSFTPHTSRRPLLERLPTPRYVSAVSLCSRSSAEHRVSAFVVPNALFAK